MKRLALFLFVSGAVLAQTMTTVVGPIKTAFNTNWQGRVTITAPALTMSDGSVSAPTSQSYNVVNGVFSVRLAPNDTASPYQVAYYAPGSSTPAWQEKWLVPASTSPVPISAVRYTGTGTSPGAGSGSSIREKVDDTFVPADAAPQDVPQDFTLSSTPLVNTVVKVYRNGILQSIGKDYTMPDSTHVSFIQQGGSVIMAGDYVKLVYFY